jgi:hypothetical protein
MRMRSRQRSQAIVEFGLIAILFVGLMFATVDFGLLLNTWLSVSSGTREIARNASVGKRATFLTDEASKLAVPAVDRTGFATSCPPCSSTSALWLRVEYFNQCVPSATCPPLDASEIFQDYGGGLANGTLGGHPMANDSVRVTFVAQGAQIITPLLRPAFGCTNSNNPHCYVPLTSTAIMRYEGAEF